MDAIYARARFSDLDLDARSQWVGKAKKSVLHALSSKASNNWISIKLATKVGLVFYYFLRDLDRDFPNVDIAWPPCWFLFLLLHVLGTLAALRSSASDGATFGSSGAVTKSHSSQGVFEGQGHSLLGSSVDAKMPQDVPLTGSIRGAARRLQHLCDPGHGEATIDEEPEGMEVVAAKAGAGGEGGAGEGGYPQVCVSLVLGLVPERVSEGLGCQWRVSMRPLSVEAILALFRSDT